MAKKFLHKSENEMAEKLSASIAVDLEKAARKRGKAFLILPGGTSPRALMKSLGAKKLPWDKIVISTTDERLVPIDSPESNAHQIRTLMNRSPVWLPAQGAFESLAWPADVMVLGMGEDGHIASIFPGMHMPPGKVLVQVNVPKPPANRLTLTMENILDTKRLILLVAGKAKWTLCQRILNGEEQALPLAKLANKAKERLELHIWDV